MTQDTITNQALREAAQTRQDFGQVLGMQMGSMGKRQQMQREMSQLGLEEGRVMNTEFQRPMEMMQRVQQMDEANKFRSLYQKRDTLQRMADMESVGMQQLGQLTEMAGNVGGMVAGFCWIAQAVYGCDNPKWMLFRHWLLTKAPDSIFYAYALNGQRIAEMVKGDSKVIEWIRDWMDARISTCLS
jgi:hypothetical protein